MSSSSWYYLRGGQQVGPVPVEQVKIALRNGTIGPSDLVWRKGLVDWVPAGNLPELAGGADPGVEAAPTARTAYAPGYISYASVAAIPGYAGFWKRVAAAIIDCLVLVMIWLVLMIPSVAMIAAIMDAAGASLDDIEAMGNLIKAMGKLVSTAAGWLYSALMESSSMQATLGKKALGIKVTDLNGDRISFARATGRYFAKSISFIILCIGYLMAAFTARKQALHDMIADTLVVNRS